MSNRSLAMMLVGIACLFAFVWGGLWFAKTQSEKHAAEAKAQEVAAAVKAKQAEESRLAMEQKQREDAAAEAERVKAENAKRTEKAASDDKATAAKREADKRRRISLFTQDERDWYAVAGNLRSMRLKAVPSLYVPGALSFLLRNADILDDIPLHKRLLEFADDRGFNELISLQELNDDKEHSLKLAFACIDVEEQNHILKLAAEVPPAKVADLPDHDKLLLRRYPKLFAKAMR